MLATSAARVVRLQMSVGRHFLLENPPGSGLFELDCFKSIWAIGKVVPINVPQCALGLVVDGHPIYKHTTLWSSSTLMLKPCLGVQCTNSAHGRLSGSVGGSVRIKLADVWPRAMCQRICNGIQMLLRERRKVHGAHASDMYPIGFGGRPRGRPRKSPLGVEDVKRGVIYDCPACIAHLHRLHPRHTRHNEPPLLCRYYNDEHAICDCEACLRTRPATDPSHILQRGCRFPTLEANCLNASMLVTPRQARTHAT